MNKAIKFHSLSRRIVTQFCLFTLLVSITFSALLFLVLYDIEDKLMETEVATEANYLLTRYQADKQWPAVRAEHFSLHFSEDSFPRDMREQFIKGPNQKEFFGEQGRHYHIYRLFESRDIFLLAEVSEALWVRPARARIAKLLLSCTLIITLLACILAWWLGRKTAKPLKQLSDLVDGIALEKIPPQFASQFPNNEIGILAKTLENSLQHIELILAREMCFTRDVSHELRTPIAIIKNTLELSKSQQQQKVFTDQEMFTLISQATEQMEQSVTTLLHLAREEHTAAAHEWVALLPIIEQSVIERSYLLEGKDITVEVLDSCNTRIYSQQGMLKVLLDNLISNAFQYTQQGSVAISFNHGTLKVNDTGPGIADDISQHITEAAVKGPQSTGYGFGLSIVKRLCEHQQWKLEIHSEQGTSIAVTLSED